MLGPNFVEDYINAVRSYGCRSPLVPASSLATPLQSLTLEDCLSYSVIPVTSGGRLARGGSDAAFVAMPHVFKRPKQGLGNRIDLDKAKRAGLRQAGFAPKDGAGMGEAKRYAGELLDRIVDVYGLPAQDPQPTPPTDDGPPTVVTAAAPPSTDAAPAIPEPPHSVRPPAHDQATPTGEDDFFRHILAKVEAAFERTDIKKLQERLGEKWFYSVCALPLRRDKDLLLGLNWGANRRTGHVPQSQQPGRSATTEVAGYPFVRRSLPLLTRYIGELASMNYLNVCPFRSPEIADLTPLDWRLAIDEFFLETIDYLRPPLTVILGTTNVAALAERNLVEFEEIRTADGGKSVKGLRGVIIGHEGKRHPFGAVPHPNNALTSSGRALIWHKVFGR